VTRPHTRVGEALRRALTTALTIPALGSGVEVQIETSRLLQDLIACAEVLHTTVRLGCPARVRTGSRLARDHDWEQALASRADTHPAVVSYLSPGDRGEPRRLSDVVAHRSWVTSQLYSQAFKGRGGRYQLSLVTSLVGGTGTGWVLLRETRDFSAEDLRLAEMLLPEVVALAEVARLKNLGRPSPTLATDWDRCAFSERTIPGKFPNVERSNPDEGRDQSCLPQPRLTADTTSRAKMSAQDCLTSRECAVLQLLSTGASARQIASSLAITEATTRKHLQHIYAKLGVHDRLTAILVSPGHDSLELRN
jgi:DNA-binding CsgD family transcriptional regulator